MYSLFEHPSTTTIHTVQQSVGVQYDKRQQQYTMTQSYKQLLYNHIIKIKSVHDSLCQKKSVKKSVKNSVHQSKTNLGNYGKSIKNNTVHESNKSNKENQIKLPYLDKKNYLSNNNMSNKQNININTQNLNNKKQKITNLTKQNILQQTRQINNLYPSLQINLGSLHQYINDKVDKKIVFTSRKKRNQGTLENIKFKKKKIASSNTEEQVLLSLITTHNQKKIASQIIVQKIFDEVYKNSLQQEKDPIQKNSLIMNGELENLGKQQSIKRKGQSRRIKFADGNDYKQQNNSNRLRNSVLEPPKRHPLKLRSIKLTPHEIITNYKKQYFRLRNIDFPETCDDFLYLISVQNQIQKHIRNVEQQKKFINRSSSLLLTAKKALEENQMIMITQPIQIQKNEINQQFFQKKQKNMLVFPQTIAKLTENQIIFKQMEFFNIQMGLYMIEYIRWDKIKIIKFQNIKIQNNILLLFLDTMSYFCPLLTPLEQLSICSIQITGIVYNSHLQLLSLKNNQLNDQSIPSISALLTNCHQLSRIQLANNQFSDKDNLKTKDSRLIL